MALFKLSWSHKTGGYSYWFNGPDEFTEQSFQNLCDFLLSEAAEKVLDEEDGWIGGGELIDKLSELLLEKGFTQVEFRSASYEIPALIDGEEDEVSHHFVEFWDQIIEHNASLREELRNGRNG